MTEPEPEPILDYISKRLHEHRARAPKAPRDRWTTEAIAAHYAVDTVLKSLIRNITAGKHLPDPADAILTECPHCRAPAGTPCRDPKATGFELG